MSPVSKKEYLKQIAPRYQKASKKDKSRLLSEFCQICGYHRKYAIDKLRSMANTPRRPIKQIPPGPKPKYRNPEVQQALKQIWITANLPCSKRLKAILPLWLPAYQHQFGFLKLDVLKLLLKISPATIDRTLRHTRHLYRGKGRCATKPGLLLKQHIPIKTNQWDEARPGFIEADTVHHCGSSLAGIYAVTTNGVDIATGWNEQRATYGIGHKEIAIQIKDIEASLPFALLGCDCDNGHEFLNQTLLRYFLDRSNPIQFTRSRPYHKNDNAHVEGKNWTHIRQWLGYRRFENPIIVTLLNDLFKNEWRLFHNFFMPSVKLQAKQRIGSKIIKRYDSPKTPYQRVLDSKFIPTENKQKLMAIFKTLDPFKLRKTIDHKIAKIHALAR